MAEQLYLLLLLPKMEEGVPRVGGLRKGRLVTAVLRVGRLMQGQLVTAVLGAGGLRQNRLVAACRSAARAAQRKWSKAAVRSPAAAAAAAL